MGYDYLMIHLTANIPWAIGITAVSWPFMTHLDWERLFSIIGVAVGATIPWDSYMIRTKVWTSPSAAVIGYKILSIPVEEIFFFAIQAYNTGMLYILLTRHLALPAYVQPSSMRARALGIISLGTFVVVGLVCIWLGGIYTYMGAMLAWAFSFLLLQWLLAAGFILALPRRELLISVILPTLFLWAVDTLALEQKTWIIEDGYKLGWQLWGSLEIEEAIFWILSNALIVFGLVVTDLAVALAHGRLANSPGSIETLPSYTQILLKFVWFPRELDTDFVTSLGTSVRRLASASQSMYIGCVMFEGALSMDLIFLYSFCRIADDLVDDAVSSTHALDVINYCAAELETRFKAKSDYHVKEDTKYLELSEAIKHLPATRMHIESLLKLLEGFRTDSHFDAKANVFPIQSEGDLDSYAYHVAGTVAASMIDLIIHHYPNHTLATNSTMRCQVLEAMVRIGQALQLVNIARDIERDVLIGRVYLPTTWLKQENITPTDVIRGQHSATIERLRGRMLDKAQGLHDRSMIAVTSLPVEVQGPLRALVENYMEIGAALKRGNRPRPGEKLKLTLWRRFLVTYRAMMA